VHVTYSLSLAQERFVRQGKTLPMDPLDDLASATAAWGLAGDRTRSVDVYVLQLSANIYLAKLPFINAVCAAGWHLKGSENLANANCPRASQ